MKATAFKTRESGFTLVEVVVVLMVASLVLMAVLGIYNRMRVSGLVILDRLEQNRLQNEILQKIAEDIDRLAAPGFDATIKFQNRVNNGYRSASLILENSYYGNKDKKEIYERIEWLTSYDPQLDSLKLYRMHGGLNIEDKVLGVDPEAPPYIPVAEGLTHFEVKARQGDNVLGAWTSDTLPKGVRVALSFALPQQLSDGTVGVPEEDVFFRTIAIDRTRLISYQFIKKKFDLPEEEDPNDISALEDEDRSEAMGDDSIDDE